MPYRCSCGAEFTDVTQYMEHKISHQQPPPSPKKGVMCLGCGAAIPTPQNYRGSVSCPSCHRHMEVTVEDGEVVIAKLR